MKPLVSIPARNYAFPTPSEYNCNTADFVDAGRNLDGVTVGDVVRSGVIKAEMIWNFLSCEQWAGLLAQFDPKRGGSFFNYAELYVQDYGAWAIRQVYVSDRSSGTFLLDEVTGKPKGHLQCRLALIEV